MKKQVSLPLMTEPLLATYHRQGNGYAMTASNPSICNWYLNTCVDLICQRRFLRGYTTPEIDIYKSELMAIPYFYKSEIPVKYLKSHTIEVIKSAIDDGRYIYYGYIDDYYIENKTFYGERHFPHDGLIYGYDNNDGTLMMYAYDKNWIYRTFKTPISGFETARRASMNNNPHARLCIVNVKPDKVELSPDEIREKLGNYLSSSFEKYPEKYDGGAYGIIVHDYIAMFLDKLISGEIPYEKTDRRVFRQIWEHKRLMQLRMQACLEKLGIESDIPEKYGSIVKTADNMRMLYASHVKKRRDTLLPSIKQKLLWIRDEEKRLLPEFIKIIT